jgi:hypothetical protein
MTDPSACPTYSPNIFDRLRTYEDEAPRENAYDHPEYTLAAVENHRIAGSIKDIERNYWKEPWTHHMAVIEGYLNKASSTSFSPVTASHSRLPFE